MRAGLDHRHRWPECLPAAPATRLCARVAQHPSLRPAAARVDASGTPRLRGGKALAARHPPRRGVTRPTRLLPRRVRLSLQPPVLTSPWRLFYTLVVNAARTPPRPYTELLSGTRGTRQRQRERVGRARRASTDERMLDPATPHRNPRRPGGDRTRLSDDASPRVPRQVRGRKGESRSRAQ
jgi:hypothetical protein